MIKQLENKKAFQFALGHFAFKFAELDFFLCW